MTWLRLPLLLARLVWLMLDGLRQLRGFSGLAAARRQTLIRNWSRRLLRACAMELRIEGEPAPGACLLAINHVSWLDIVALNAAHPTRFVAKAEVDRWPLIGALARGAGTLFIERERPRDAMRVMHDMAAALRAGAHVSVFPEGTTSDGSTILPLHANLFQAAVSAGVVVQPVLLRYVDARSGRTNAAPAYIGDDSILLTLRRIATARQLQVCVHYLAPLQCTERRALARQVQEALELALRSATAGTAPQS
jgi:1-acyl-sn-glycerol-3-phosphate acyltransferase